MTMHVSSHERTAPAAPSAGHAKRSIWIDLETWTIVGAVALLFAGPAAALLALPVQAVRLVGIFLFLGAPVSLWFIHTRVGYTPGLVRLFVLFNVVASVLMWVVLLLGLLPVNRPLWWTLAAVAELSFLFGLYQFYALRRLP